MDTDYITFNSRDDEYGDRVFEWFCHGCGEGGGTYDPQTTEQEADEHEAMHERMAGEAERGA